MFGDKTSKKYADNKRLNLAKYEMSKLPSYIQLNKNQFKQWID